MDPETWATSIVRRNAASRARSVEWSGRMAEVLSHEDPESLNELINGISSESGTTGGDATTPPGSTGTSEPMDQPGDVQVDDGITSQAGGE